MTDGIETRYQWLSQLNVDHVPAERNFRRTSIICTIGMSLDPRSLASGLANKPLFFCFFSSIGPKTNSVESINKLRKGTRFGNYPAPACSKLADRYS